MDKIEGFLEVGHTDDTHEVVINHPDLKPDKNGVGHIVFSPGQARSLAHLLIKRANEAEAEAHLKYWRDRETQVPPVDRSATVLTDGSPVTPDHREIDPITGMQKGYVTLSAEERSKGFVRPVRRSYTHTVCHSLTTMGIALAETYARDPTFYSGTFCCSCRAHFPLDQFVWAGTDERLGT